MKVKDLRDRLAEMPDWMEVVVESNGCTAPLDEARESGGEVQLSANLDLGDWEDW